MTRLLIDTGVAQGTSILLKGDELHYLARVRRHTMGDMVELIDPAGKRFKAVVNNVSSTEASLNVLSALPDVPDALLVHLIVAVPKRNLLDDVVRKANEMGVARITPVIVERSVVKAGGGKLARWKKIAAESVRQCGRLKPIQVDEVTDLNSALRDVGPGGLRAILHPGERSLPITSLFEKLDLTSAAVVIGPEGGFTESEIIDAKKRDFQPVSMGNFIMRVETAAIMAAALSVAFVGGLD